MNVNVPFDVRHEQVKELIKDRISKLGPIKADDAWQLCREKMSYNHVCTHFKIIMLQMVRDGKADRIRNGSYFIHKNNLCPKKSISKNHAAKL